MNLSDALRLTPGSIVTLTGAGGKTTAMLRLGRELAASGLGVVATTTTHLGLDQLALFPAHLVAPKPGLLGSALKQTPFLLAVASLDEQQGKAVGFGPEQIAELREYADVILVEGDGSRGLPVKAPAAHEPVIPPETTHLLCCLGLWALTRPLDANSVHRPEIFARLTGLTPGDPITSAVLARLLLHPHGPARGAPNGAERYLLLNGADTEYPIPNTQCLLSRISASPQFSAVLLAQTAHDPPVLARYGKTAAIILAAGASTRFGSAKQLHDWQGQPLLRHVVLQALAAPVQQVIVVLGAHFEDIAPSLHGLPVELVYNSAWAQGQSSSMKAGLDAAAPGTQAALFILGDQPRLPADLLHRLVDAHRRTLAPIVAPRHQGRRGNPVLFDRSLFGELLEVEGDTGGRALLRRYEEQIAWVEAAADVFDDIDRPGN